MSYSNFHLAQRMVELHREEQLRRAAAHRLAREATAGRRGWLAEASAWAACRLGQALEVVGQRLQGCEPSPERGLVAQER